MSYSAAYESSPALMACVIYEVVIARYPFDALDIYPARVIYEVVIARYPFDGDGVFCVVTA